MDTYLTHSSGYHVPQKCAKEFVIARMEAARSSVKQWEALKAELENTVRRYHRPMLCCSVHG